MISTEGAGLSRVAVFGLGYVGSVTAACLAHIGNRVVGVDRDAFKVNSILAGQAPFYEPGLGELIRDAMAAGRLSATVSCAEAIAEADVALVCVGTPSAENGNMSLEQLDRVCEEIAACAAGRARPLAVAIRSTVFPGTCQDLAERIFAGREGITVVSNPEFLREGTAVRDFMEPSLVVVGGDEPAAVGRVAAMYAPLGVEPCLVSLRTAEIIKYACNAFHAVKIAFANEMGALCGRLDVSAAEVMETLCRDVKLNLSAAYLKPGFAFGGSCLPKDLRALTYRSLRLDLRLPLLESVLPSNQSHLERAIREALAMPVQRIGIFGLAFKENTDDLRESPAVALIEQLLGKGRDIRVFDPHIRLDDIYGSNRRFIFNAVPHIGRLMAGSLEEVLEWAEHVIVVQRPSPEAARAIVAGARSLADPAGVFPSAQRAASV